MTSWIHFSRLSNPVEPSWDLAHRCWTQQDWRGSAATSLVCLRCEQESEPGETAVKIECSGDRVGEVEFSNKAKLNDLRIWTFSLV